MARPIQIHHPSYKGDKAKPITGRFRARVMFDLSDCEKCGKSGVERHHKDGNTLNNHSSNIAILCRRCHMSEDGRLDKIAHGPKFTKEAEQCRICKTPAKPMRKGRCHRCNEFLRRNGVEWSIGARYSSRAVSHSCGNCQRAVPLGWSKGRCPACRIFFTKHGIERPAKRIFDLIEDSR